MLFSPLFVPPKVEDAVSERAWIQAMLDAEAALARAEARVGVIPAAAAEEIASCCVAERFDAAALGVEARRTGNPAEPLVRALRHLVPDEAAGYVHVGATSQDILDTASMLIARRALVIIDDDLARLAGHCARLAREHRDTLMAGRTLLQQAVPITFGRKAAGWLAGVTRARSALRRLHGDALAAELGGAAGTLATLGDAGIAVLHVFAAELRLAEPELPWHTERTRVAEIASALGLTAGALDRIALDIVLLAQTEVGEVAEGGEESRGGSSTMPQKRNPVGCVLARACVRETQAHVEVLMRGMAQEHERGAGPWHAEWPALSAALAWTGGAAAGMADVVEHLEVDPERMRANLDVTHGLVMSERLSLLLTERMGRQAAHDLIRSVGRRAGDEGGSFRDVLLADERVRGHLSAQEIERALDPATYLGSTRAFIDRTFLRHHRTTGIKDVSGLDAHVHRDRALEMDGGTGGDE